MVTSSVAVALGQQEVRRRRRDALAAAEQQLERLEHQRLLSVGLLSEWDGAR